MAGKCQVDLKSLYDPSMLGVGFEMSHVSLSVFLIQTIGAAFVAKSISVSNKVITLGIWVSPVVLSGLPFNEEVSGSDKPLCFLAGHGRIGALRGHE